MSEERHDDALEVPLGPVEGGSGGRGRARLALAIGFAAVAIAIGLASLPQRGVPPSTAGTPGLGFGQAIVPSSSSPPLPSASTARAQPSSSRHEILPPLANDALAGAPTSILVERRGNDARLVAWNPGGPATLLRSFPNAFSSETQLAAVSPDATSLLVATFHQGGEEGQDEAQLITGSGHIAWTGRDITTLQGIVWSSDSRSVALVGGSGTWVIVTIDSTGTAASHSITVDGAAASPAAAAPTTPPSHARPSPSPSEPAGRLVPIGFSADGAWLYGGVVSSASGSTGPTVRVALPSGVVEPIPGYAADGSAGIDPNDNLRGIDPATGRALRWGPNASIPGGPPTIEVAEPDGTLAYRLETGVVLGAAWIPTGDLLILEADGYPFPTQLRLLAVSPDGKAAPPVLTTGPIAYGGIVGTRNGFAVLWLGTRQPTDSTQLVAIDLANGASAGLTLPADETGVMGAGLLP